MTLRLIGDTSREGIREPAPREWRAPLFDHDRREWWDEIRARAGARVILERGDPIYVAESFDELASMLPGTSLGHVLLHVVSTEWDDTRDTMAIHDPPLRRLFLSAAIRVAAPVLDR